MELEENTEKYQENYSESSFWDKIKKFARKAGIKLIYLALLLFYTLQSGNLSLTDKAIIYGALGYFILPIDLIPDWIPIIGLSDDFGTLMYAYKRIKENITDEIREKAEIKLMEIFGNFDKAEIEGL